MIVVARTSKSILNDSVESGHPCLVLDLSGNASPLRMMFAVCLSYMGFIILSYVPSMPTFWTVLQDTGVEFCQKLFLNLLR